MPDIILKDRNGNDVTYEGIETVTFDTTTQGKQATFTAGVAVEGLEIVPDFSGGDMAVAAGEGALVKSAIIKTPENLAPENIRNGARVGGVEGAFPAYPFIEYTRNEAGEITIAKMYGFTTIPAGCFSNMPQLETVDISESPGITSIGNHAFYTCQKLVNFEIPETVTSIGNSAFYMCAKLGNIRIPNGVPSIGANTFYGCTALTSIDIPNSVTSIGNSAFNSCSGLTSVNLSSNLISIGNTAFSLCTALTSITIPDSVTSIGDNAFLYCTNMTSVTIGSGVTKIGKNAFSNSGLTSATFKDTTTWYRTTSSSYNNGTSTSVSNASTAATYLKTTYVSYYWYKT
jgi:hypothetical protein